MKKKARVLIIDDDRELVNLVKFNFQQRGWEVFTSYDGMDAILKINRNKPDIIISDIRMPGVDGFSLLETIKADETLDDLPFIFLTGDNRIESRIKGIGDGADDYIVKPFVFEELFARVKNRLQTAHRIKALESKGLRGNFDVLSLSDILQNLASAGKNGKLIIETEFFLGEILIKEGKIIGASMPRRNGWDAFYTLLTLERGSFQFNETQDVSGEMSEPIEKALLECARQMDEEKRIIKLIGGRTSTYTVITENLNPLDKECIMVVEKIKEGFNFEEIARFLPISSYKIAMKIFSMLSEGYIKRF
ncbi:response regulator [candidate division WOR-3 bacterium]|nr:response regulator [candidate division WOR-3 bacterium]